ncbi:Pt1-cadherin-like protein [Dinothrombium tinctorium]|uniref:Pt1-cadherin-like protein n=1 Tax=Dinothrombium tinctorium TaxID=1965070 RepID=A0A443RDB4_9ACAR|nr:Pt1-cadherin-like protein [Dinothrombium tinctorium]
MCASLFDAGFGDNASNKLFTDLSSHASIDNDNYVIPSFDRNLYEYYIPSNADRDALVGNVTANYVNDVSYHLVARHPVFYVVPKKGELRLIAKPQLSTYHLLLYASDCLKPSRKSSNVSVIIRVYEEVNDSDNDNQVINNDAEPEIIENDDESSSTKVTIRRSKRSVRPPKTYEFKESDGSSPGAVVVSLDKKHPMEVFKLESTNRWVTVDTNGAVRVKEPWDYEQLEKHKSIDFWVFVTGPNLNGKQCKFFSKPIICDLF